LEISPIGYWGAGLALLLMGLRPAIRMQAYIIQKLYSIKQEVYYPREDAYELRNLANELKMRLENVEYQLDGSNKDSFSTLTSKDIELLKEGLKKLRTQTESLDVKNQAEHERLSRKSEDALAKLGEDAQFLGQVRDLIRFIKTA
jgi:hypothetical protein